MYVSPALSFSEALKMLLKQSAKLTLLARGKGINFGIRIAKLQICQNPMQEIPGRIVGRDQNLPVPRGSREASDIFNLLPLHR